MADAVSSRQHNANFLTGGGEMGAAMRRRDWSLTSVGDPAGWPMGLRMAVQLLLNTGHPMYIWWGTELACFYNDAYARSLGPERHPGSLGLPAREVWGEIWPVIGPQIEQVMSGGGHTWHENALVPITRNGRRDDVYWTYGYSPIRDETTSGGIGGVLVVCTETTPQVIAEQRLSAQVRRQREQFEQAPGFICVLTGPQHVYEFVNQAYKKLVGTRPLVGMAVRDAVPELAEQGFSTLLDQVYSSGQRHVAYRTPIRLTRGGLEVERFLNFIYEPMFDEGGQVSGIFVEGFDVTGEHLAQQAQQRQARHLQLLVDELNHRVKNTLSIVQGLAYQTFRGQASMDARDAFEGRLLALAAAHDSLTQANWEGADLEQIVRQALALHGMHVERYTTQGPALSLSPEVAVNMAMLMHELSTNAYKYGALSNDAGTVQVSWSVEAQAAPRRLHLQWQEQGGPPVSTPSRHGFGSNLLARMIAADPSSQMGLEFLAGGVVCKVCIDLPNAAQAGEEPRETE